MSVSTGEVFDLGYQHYEGPREGRGRARKALCINGVRTALGLGRGSRAKVLPALLFISVMSPAVILSLVASQLGPGGDIPGHAGYYQLVSVFLLLFSAVIAPELLCRDRREGVIHLYLVRPLTPTDYVAGRWLAFFLISLAIIYSGQLVLLIGFTLSAAEPLGYLRDNWLDIPRFLGAGLAIALFTTSLPMAVSAFTARRAYAAAFVIGLYVISAAFASALTGCEEGHSGTRASFEGEGPPTQCRPPTGDAAKWVALIDIGHAPIGVNDRIFGEENSSNTAKLLRELPGALPVAWYLLLTLGPGFALWWRYRRIAT